MTEVFIIISGDIQISVNMEEYRLGPGDAIIIEPHEVHKMTNLGATEANYIVFGVATEQGGRTICI
jgi:mannose-6-phosphate isomerase-like protein (cupin superfamily)